MEWQFYNVSLNIVCIISFCITGVISGTSKTCNNVGTFQQQLDVSLSVCAEECLRRQRCQIFMFRHGMNYCALKDQMNISSLNESRSMCGYHNRDEWSQVSLGSCSGHNCSVTERCNSKTDSEFECLKSECSMPEKIPNAILASTTHAIGTTNKYKCINGHGGVGNSTITCNGDAQWSKNTFRCVKCPTPIQEYTNAYLSAEKGNGYKPGSELTFTCRDGYKGTNDEVKSVCRNSGKWKPENIRCCHDNSTTDIDGQCVAIVERSTASTYTAARQHCIIMGGEWRWITKTISTLFSNTTTGYVLQNRKVSWFNNINNWNYSKCAAENGEVAEPNITLKEKIAKVKNNTWTTRNCYWGTIWADDQPSAGTNENCVTLIPEDYKHYQSPCSFQNMTLSFACKFSAPTI